MSFMAELQLGKAVERRRSPRKAGRAPRLLSAPAGQTITVLVRDISLHGFRAEIGMDLAVGAEVHLALAGPKPVAAVVVWHEGAEYGCEFVTPISAVALADAFSGRMVVE